MDHLMFDGVGIVVEEHVVEMLHCKCSYLQEV